jgi:hypothetical protein
MLAFVDEALGECLCVLAGEWVLFVVVIGFIFLGAVVHEFVHAAIFVRYLSFNYAVLVEVGLTVELAPSLVGAV